MHKLVAGLITALLLLGIGGCNGNDNTFAGGSASSSSDTSLGSTSTGGAATGSDNAPTVLLGSGSGTSFKDSVLQIDSPKLSAGGQTAVRVTLVNSDGTPYTQATDVTFTSACVQQGLATLDSPVSTSTGGATSTYTAKGCEGDDTVTATADVNGTTLKAHNTAHVASATAGSIKFLSADPSTLSYKGSGLDEASRVSFEVLDGAGSPIADQKVQFALSPEPKDPQHNATLADGTDTATSGSDGKVSTVVQAGTQHTTVRVLATLVGSQPVISTQSSKLAISTGIADRDSFSLSAATQNPEAFEKDGVTDELTVHMADRFNNPVPDGTAVSFHTEGGSVGGQCVTADGACSVTWVSQNPRPRDGRVTVLAYAIGEESFDDVNGNGVFDDQDQFLDTPDPKNNMQIVMHCGANKSESCDLPEPFEDDNENKQHDNGEFFSDFNNNGKWDSSDRMYEGLQCQGTDPAHHCGTNTTSIGRQLTLIMAGSDADITTDQSQPIPLGSGTSFHVIVTDDRSQIMPAGTTISLAANNLQIVGPSNFTVANTKTFTPHAVRVEPAKNPQGPPSIVVTVTTPGGTVTTGFIDFK